MKRVVVTGMGAIAPNGIGTENFWNGCKEGKVGIKLIDRFDTTEMKAHVAGQVDGFEPKEFMDPKKAKRMARFTQFAVAAAGEAIKESGLDLEKEDLNRIGCSIGSGTGGMEVMEKNHKAMLEKGLNRVSPMFVPMMISNMAAGNVAIEYQLKGKCINVVTACTSGTNSVGEAYRAIQANEADVMVAGGAEACITPFCLAGFAALTALSKSEDPLRASIPFDKERDGFVMSEGAGVVVLESLDHAKARGANIIAEVVGYGSTCDAYHITSPAEDGDGAARAMLFAVNEAGIKPEEVEYCNAHGTSTHHNDLFETKAIKKAFGDHAYDMNISSTKSMIGHGLGAAGALEFIISCKTVQEDFIHATVGYQVPDEECDLNYTKEAVRRKVNYAISNSLGFGGHNGSLLVKKYTD